MVLFMYLLEKTERDQYIQSQKLTIRLEDNEHESLKLDGNDGSSSLVDFIV